MLLFIIAVVIIVVALMAVGLYQKNTNKVCRSKKRLDGRTALVTGGTIGIGLRIAIDFADRGARVIVACPFADEGDLARRKIIDKTENDNVVFKLLDLSSCTSTRRFASEIHKNEERLDILINNAGIGSINEMLTKDGMNCTMQVNYYGHFLLTLLLLPLMKRTGTADEPARIVNTSSVLHNLGSTDFEMMDTLNHFHYLQIYGNSKLCVIMFTRELAKRLKDANIAVNVVDPGAVGTTIFRDYGEHFGNFITFLILILFKTPWQGAQTALHVSLDKKAGRVSGEFFKNCEMSRPKQSACHEELARKLWEHSRKQVNFSDREQEQCFNL